jgi:hypothetical protein
VLTFAVDKRRRAARPQAKDAVIYCVLPLVGISYYCAAYKEAEKQHHRY